MKDRIIIGSRGSALALVQTNQIAEKLRACYPQITIEIKIIKTKGDKVIDTPLAKIGDKGLFVKELENALLSHEIDLAVHSLKDLPTEIPSELTIAAIPEREDPHDALILAKTAPKHALETRENPLDLLAQGARVGSSSLRRKSQLLHHRPDLQIEDLRGNIDTRLRKLDEGQYDAIILASAGLIRLGWEDRISARLPFQICLPAVGQGALGLECRSGDEEMQAILAPLNNQSTTQAVQAERALLRSLEGGCQIPIGAYGQVEDERLILQGVIADLEGKQLVRGSVEGRPDEADELGQRLAQDLLDDGGQIILEQVKAGAKVSWSEPDGGQSKTR